MSKPIKPLSLFAIKKLREKANWTRRMAATVCTTTSADEGNLSEA